MGSDWKFPDPEDLATFTERAIVERERPVLYAAHDVSDGGWQFLTGGELSEAGVQLVSLAQIVELDPSLAQLADLPLGWHAERVTAESAWVREAQFPRAWDELLAQAQAYTEDGQERLKEDLNLLEWERYDYNQQSGTLLFSSEGLPRARARIQIVGSWAAKPKTWFWSWANASVLPSASEYVHVLETYGKQHGLTRLSNSLFSATESDAWELACVACLLLAGDGVYRAPDEDGALFMVLSDAELIEG
jgi:hypothetical protein